MAFLDFLTDTWGALSGGNAPQLQYNTLSPQQSLSGGFDIATGLMPQYKTLNQLKADADIANQLRLENTALGPAANQLQKGYYNSILDQLNFGENLSPALQADLTRQIFESRGRAGTGGTQLGAESGIYELALQGERRGQQRRAEAFGAIGALPSTSYAYNPIAAPNPYGFSDMLQQQNQRQNEIENENRMIDAQNTQKNLQFGVKLAAIGAGIAFPPLGAAMLGGSMLGGIGGPQQGIGGQGGMGNILSIFSRPPPSVATSGFPIGSDQYSDPNAPMFRR